MSDETTGQILPGQNDILTSRLRVEDEVADSIREKLEKVISDFADKNSGCEFISVESRNEVFGPSPLLLTGQAVSQSDGLPEGLEFSNERVAANRDILDMDDLPDDL